MDVREPTVVNCEWCGTFIVTLDSPAVCLACEGKIEECDPAALAKFHDAAKAGRADDAREILRRIVGR
jgi:hypothetical protein